MTTENIVPSADEQAKQEASKDEASKDISTDVGTQQPAGDPVPPVAAPEPVQFQKTGDAALDVALDWFGKAGLKPDSAAMVLAQKGDFSVLKAELASKGKAGWEQYVSIAEEAHGRATTAATAKAAAVKAAILSVAGDQASWDAIRTFVGAKADPGELAEINAAIKAGGLAAKATVKYMKDVFLAAGQVLPGQEKSDLVVNTNRQLGITNSGGPLTAREYSDAVQALAAKIGSNRVEGSAEYRLLKQRRQAGMV